MKRRNPHALDALSRKAGPMKDKRPMKGRGALAEDYEEDLKKKCHYIEYWTFWANDQVCSKHKSEDAAIRAAKKCEKEGGALHDIYRVERIK